MREFLRYRMLREALQTEFAVPRAGRYRALLIGVDYLGTRNQLRGCINDVHNMTELLTKTYGWDRRSIRTLTDDEPQAMPTHQNIVTSMQWLVDGARPGDVRVFLFCGHGGQQTGLTSHLERDGLNETILPVDFQRAGQITDDRLGELLWKRLPEGVRVTSVMDCCHSGTGLDLPFMRTDRGWREEAKPYHGAADVQLFSACQDDQCAAETPWSDAEAGGAMTTAFCDVLRANPRPSYGELMVRLHEVLGHRGFHQKPQLSSAQAFSFDRHFLLDVAVPNLNQQHGRAAVEVEVEKEVMEEPLASRCAALLVRRSGRCSERRSSRRSQPSRV